MEFLIIPLSSYQILPLQLSEDQILALAPDDASKKAGKDLAIPAKWLSKGINETAIWGECQGSGSKPYQTQIDTSNLSFKCSCPSRKFPCKHGLGLMFLHCNHPNIFTDNLPPRWVAEWLEKRNDHAEKKTAQKEKPIDEIAQAKRLNAREELIADGSAELLLWMKDLVRNGILDLPEKGTVIFDHLAKRMVDAKAPGLSLLVKKLGNINFYKEGWQSFFVSQLSQIYLVITGFKNRGNINTLLGEDIKSNIGFTYSQETLKEQKGTVDNWLVLGKQVNEDDTITTERNWLYGTQSKQYALVLQFSIRGQGIAFSLTPGLYIQAELVFFPSAVPLRAIIKNQTTSNSIAAVQSFGNWMEVFCSLTKMNASCPLAGYRPFLVQQLHPVMESNHWWLKDATNHIVQLPENFPGLYKLLSLSGGKALDMFVIENENIFEPLGLWLNDQYIII